MTTAARQFDCLIENGRVVTCAGPREGAAAELGILMHAAVGIVGGRITWVGHTKDAKEYEAQTRIDAEGGVIMPGLVDCHTHLVFAGSRVDEFARKMAGENYLSIAAGGGGIASTVRATRAATDDTLYDLAKRRALAMRALGTTTIEIKSGYGLSLEHELRLLRIARRLDSEKLVRTSSTFLGAHTVPAEKKHARAEYVDEVKGVMLDAVVKEGLADACDVYIDEGAFTLDEGRAILERASHLGLRVKAHAGQFTDLGAPELVAELGGLSCDHLEHVSAAGLAAMAQAGTTAVLLPAAWSTLRDKPPDVAKLRENNVPMAIATDANPGTSPCLDLPLAAALAVREAGVTADEALLCVTSRAARALGRDDIGRLEPGALADILVYAHEDPRTLAYALGNLRPRHVLLAGTPVATTPTPPIW